MAGNLPQAVHVAHYTGGNGEFSVLNDQFSVICAIGTKEAYPYTNELLALEACEALGATPLPPRWCMITTPLNLEAWARCLADHPDKLFVTYILHRIACGFRVEFEAQSKLKSQKRT